MNLTASLLDPAELVAPTFLYLILTRPILYTILHTSKQHTAMLASRVCRIRNSTPVLKAPVATLGTASPSEPQGSRGRRVAATTPSPQPSALGQEKAHGMPDGRPSSSSSSSMSTDANARQPDHGSKATTATATTTGLEDILRVGKVSKQGDGQKIFSYKDGDV